MSLDADFDTAASHRFLWIWICRCWQIWEEKINYLLEDNSSAQTHTQIQSKRVALGWKLFLCCSERLNLFIFGVMINDCVDVVTCLYSNLNSFNTHAHAQTCIYRHITGAATAVPVKKKPKPHGFLPNTTKLDSNMEIQLICNIKILMSND